MKIVIEKVIPDDAEELTKVATAAKKHWGYPDEWIDLWQEDLTITPEKIHSRDYYAGRIGQAFIFVYSISPISGTTYELADCWMAPEYIGQGHGRTLFAHLITTLKSRGCTKLPVLMLQVAGGRWQVAGCKWQVASGRLQVASFINRFRRLRRFYGGW